MPKPSSLDLSQKPQRRRLPHYLKPTKASQSPTTLAFLHVSSQSTLRSGILTTHGFSSASLLVWRRAEGEHKRNDAQATFTCAPELWKWLTGKVRARSRLIVVSERPVRDLAALDFITHLQLLGWKAGNPISSSRLTMLPWRKDDKKLLFVAHSNLFSNERGLPENPAAHIEELKSTWLSHFDLLREHDLGGFRLTRGSQALAIFRHRFLDHAILIHNDAEALKVERRSTLGACYQPFFAGEAPRDKYYYLDINSMYPWCMAANELPWRLKGRLGRVGLPVLREKLKKFSCVATVALSTPTPHYPVRHEGRTIFPTGTFTTTLTTPDLKGALEAGHITGIHTMLWYDQALLFSSYVRVLWQLRNHFRDAGDAAHAKMCKAWLVSLYGKFGAHRYEHREEAKFDPGTYGHGTYRDASTGESRPYFLLDGAMITTGRAGEPYDSFPAIMAHIAAYGRREMFRLMKKAGRGNVFFCLSDGLIVNQAGYDKLDKETGSKKLGGLRLKRQADLLSIRSDTEIILGAHTWLPGIKKGSRQIEDGVFLATLDPGLGLLLEAGDPATYKQKQVKISLTRRFRTGTPGPDGWISPIHL